MTKIKNLVFDIGNVLVDIDYDVMVAEFQKLAREDFGQLVSYSHQYPVFDLMDKGQLSSTEFREALRKYLKHGVSDMEIDQAWDSILIAYPTDKFMLLRELKKRYRTFALSNTNELHIKAFNGAVNKKFGEKDFAAFFNAAYYSNEIGYRKPDKEIYEYIMEKESLIPSETFFVDDKEENIIPAKALGWQAYQLKERDKLNDLLIELKII